MPCARCPSRTPRMLSADVRAACPHRPDLLPDVRGVHGSLRERSACPGYAPLPEYREGYGQFTMARDVPRNAGSRPPADSDSANCYGGLSQRSAGSGARRPRPGTLRVGSRLVLTASSVLHPHPAPSDFGTGAFTAWHRHTRSTAAYAIIASSSRTSASARRQGESISTAFRGADHSSGREQTVCKETDGL